MAKDKDFYYKEGLKRAFKDAESQKKPKLLGILFEYKHRASDDKLSKNQRDYAIGVYNGIDRYMKEGKKAIWLLNVKRI